MKPRAGIATVLLGLALLPASLPAGEPGAPAKPARTRVQMQLHRLLRAEAGPAAPAAPTADREVESGAVAEGTLQLAPMIVEEKAIQVEPVETKVATFLRTGTIWQKVGPRFTREIWVGRGKGIGFTLSW